jgi:hypothetical protein
MNAVSLKILFLMMKIKVKEEAKINTLIHECVLLTEVDKSNHKTKEFGELLWGSGPRPTLHKTPTIR